MMWSASDSGRLLEVVGDDNPRLITVLDRTRLTGQLFCMTNFFSVLIVSWESRYHLKVLFNGIFWENVVEYPKILKS